MLFIFRNSIMICLCLLFLQCKTTAEESQTPIKNKPNVVLILVDDLGWTDLGSFGSDLYKSPNIDKLADEGIIFSNSYSACTVCSPTRSAIVTGKYPARTNVTDWIQGHKYPWAKLNVPDWTMFLDDAEYTIAEAFKDAGYETAHFGKWHLGEKEENWPENHGFDVNIGGWLKGAPNRNKKEGYNGYFSPYGNPRLADGPEGEYLTERLSNEVVDYIDNNKDKPFFINFWLYNVHTPLQAKPEKIKKYKSLSNKNARHQNATYAAMVEHTDDAVGKIISKLKETGLYENTIMLFSSDNGGLLGSPKNPITSNKPLRRGKGDIYEGGTRIPTILYAPNIKSDLKKVDEPIISTDYYPTLVDLAEITSSKTLMQTIDGKSLVPVLNNSSDWDREAIYWHYPHYHQQGGVPYSAVRAGSWKLIQLFETNTYELYNLEEDISETNNLISEAPEMALKLKTMLQNWQSDVKAQFPSANQNFIKEKERKKK